MADPICRWRNASIKQLMEFNSLFPFESLDKNSARNIVEKRWSILGGDSFFTTPYQLAAQMGVYYEDKECLYPRFSEALSLEDAQKYMLRLGKRYYAPNPYTKSLNQTQKPIVINNFLVNWCLEKTPARFSDALKVMFTESIGNTDILVNFLNNFSEVSVADDIITLKKDAPSEPYDEVYLDIDKNDKKSFFEYIAPVLSSDVIGSKIWQNLLTFPLQQIFYGAPGTGKSHSVEEVCKEYTHFRTTFHPDSDYSTFVGCYKPTMINGERIYNSSELISKLTDIKNTGTSYPCHKFATKYWESLKDLSTAEIKDILSACGFTDSMNVEISKGIAIGQYMASNVDSKKIAYSFVPQAFIKAYIEAWKDLSNPVFLIIEEINRGNCAQIFGDLFQLLDRNEQGYSSYEIEADSDLQQYIASQGLSVEELVDNDENPIEDKLNNGEILCLPPNLYIWATMNTSDQSLFPIDSAFKRRWDWKYVPINTEAKSGWKIVVDGKNYSWSSFLDKINDEIDTTTSSEDKQLGFFFCKADSTDENDNNGTISAEKFVGKVLFYIYNDVFKDYGLDQEFFKDKENAGKKISFRSLFKMNGDINETQVAKILDNLGVEIVEEDLDEEYEDGEEYEDEGARVSDTNAPYRVTFPDGEIICEGSGWETYVASLQKIGLNKALPFGEMYSRLNKTLPLITKKKIADQGVYKYYEVDGFYVLSGTDSQHRLLKRMNKDLNLGLTIE